VKLHLTGPHPAIAGGKQMRLIDAGYLMLDAGQIKRKIPYFI
jgi:hypothetical protein